MAIAERERAAETPIEETVEDLAEAIHKLADAVDTMKRVGLMDRAVVLLLSDVSGVGKVDVRRVLNAMRELRKTYLRPVA